MGEPTEREWLEGLRLEDEMEFYLRPDFPSDEDVEVAAEAWKQARQSPIVNLAAARAALQAAADARRTEEET